MNKQAITQTTSHYVYNMAHSTPFPRGLKGKYSMYVSYNEISPELLHSNLIWRFPHTHTHSHSWACDRAAEG